MGGAAAEAPAPNANEGEQQKKTEENADNDANKKDYNAEKPAGVEKKAETENGSQLRRKRQVKSNVKPPVDAKPDNVISEFDGHFGKS